MGGVTSAARVVFPRKAVDSMVIVKNSSKFFVGIILMLVDFASVDNKWPMIIRRGNCIVLVYNLIMTFLSTESVDTITPEKSFENFNGVVKKSAEKLSGSLEEARDVLAKTWKDPLVREAFKKPDFNAYTKSLEVARLLISREHLSPEAWFFTRHLLTVGFFKNEQVSDEDRERAIVTHFVFSHSQLQKGGAEKLGLKEASVWRSAFLSHISEYAVSSEENLEEIEHIFSFCTHLERLSGEDISRLGATKSGARSEIIVHSIVRDELKKNVHFKNAYSSVGFSLPECERSSAEMDSSGIADFVLTGRYRFGRRVWAVIDAKTESDFFTWKEIDERLRINPGYYTDPTKHGDLAGDMSIADGIGIRIIPPSNAPTVLGSEEIADSLHLKKARQGILDDLAAQGIPVVSLRVSRDLVTTGPDSIGTVVDPRTGERCKDLKGIIEGKYRAPPLETPLPKGILVSDKPGVIIARGIIAHNLAACAVARAQCITAKEDRDRVRQPEEKEI